MFKVSSKSNSNISQSSEKNKVACSNPIVEKTNSIINPSAHKSTVTPIPSTATIHIRQASAAEKQTSEKLISDYTASVQRRKEVQAQKNEISGKLDQLNAQAAQQQQCIGSLDRKIIEHSQKAAECGQNMAACRQNIEAGNQRIAALNQQQAINNANAINAQQKMLAAGFAMIFGLKLQKMEDLKALYEHYLRGPAIEADPVSKSIKIHNMDPIIQYISHTNVTSCNFTICKEAVQDIVKFANFISAPSCSVQSVTFARPLTSAESTALIRARTARGGSLTINCPAHNAH